MSTENKSAAEIAAEVKAAFDLKLDAVKAIAEEVKGKLEKGEEISASAKELADQAITGMNESKARLDEIEQKMARKGSGEGDERKSLGEMATEGKEAEIAALASSRGRVSMEVKAIISSLTTDANGSAGDLVVPQRGGLVGPVQRRMTIRDLLTPGRTTSSSIQYPQETRSEEHTSELQSLMRISYAVFCLKKKKKINHIQ